MQEKMIATKEAEEQYLREKSQVDDIVQKIIAEEMRLKDQKEEKKKIAFDYMQTAQRDKEERNKQLKELEEAENKKYLEFIAAKAQKEAEYKQVQEEKNQAKFPQSLLIISESSSS